MYFLINSPLEQFEAISLYSYFINIPLFFFTNFILATFFIVMLYCIMFDFFFTKVYFNSLFIYTQKFVEFLITFIFNLLSDNSGIKTQKFFPLILTLSVCLLIINLIGMLPFGLTFTAHIVTTFCLSFIIFFSVNFIGIKQHKLCFLSLFLPKGTPFILIPFLFGIEILSYFARLFSLAIRLMSNLMSGHTLLKILVSFTFSSFCLGGSFLIVNILPIMLIHIIIVIEICIAFLQCYVFIVLSLIYIKDAIELH